MLSHPRDKLGQARVSDAVGVGLVVLAIVVLGDLVTKRRELSLFLQVGYSYSNHSILLKERERPPTARHHSFRRGG